MICFVFFLKFQNYSGEVAFVLQTQTMNMIGVRNTNKTITIQHVIITTELAKVIRGKQNQTLNFMDNM